MDVILMRHRTIIIIHFVLPGLGGRGSLLTTLLTASIWAGLPILTGGRRFVRCWSISGDGIIS